jgi:type II secretory ATPase GspE/PulE/Tfp pilus assembly ATPase PilB-like protein
MLIKKTMLGDLLIQENKISQNELQKAIDIQKASPENKKLGEILIEKGLVSEEVIMQLLSKQLNIPIEETITPNFILSRKVPAKILEKYKVLPIKEDPKSIEVAFADPLDIEAQNTISRYFKKPIQIVISSEKEILKHINQLKNREKANSIIEQMKKEIAGNAETAKEEESATMQFIKYLVTLSVSKGASDIHIETDEEAMSVRSRIDGVLQELISIEKELFSAVAARIKLLSNLNISEKRKPQDGRFSMELNGNHFDFRVSTLPIATGESIVIRILDKRNIMKELEDIGINSENLDKWKKALKAPNGIVLVTGPTGSGKSTTLYASLNRIKSVEEKVITVEDPVEYQIKLVQQVNVNEAAGLTFAAALRSILRQDPDIIMVGEIRDLETLEIAIKAALTGHLVLSTLHTNDAISAISRMIDMGADPFMVGAATVGIEAQRLVRRICPYCKTKSKPNPALIEPLKEKIPGIETKTFYKGKGCDYCNNTGYKGRTLITEIFIIDDELSSMIAKNVSLNDLEIKAKQKEYKPMFIDGLVKALQGETTLEEIFRVAKVNL